MLTRSSKPLKPFMAYIDETQYNQMKKFCNKNKLAMSQLIREGIQIRITPGNPYTEGYNAGIKSAMKVVADNKASAMRFPSGKSFAELINEDLEKVILHENVEG
jgi:hypothetical protein